jgi:hypothetical protein
MLFRTGLTGEESAVSISMRFEQVHITQTEGALRFTNSPFVKPKCLLVWAVGIVVMSALFGTDLLSLTFA